MIWSHTVAGQKPILTELKLSRPVTLIGDISAVILSPSFKTGSGGTLNFQLAYFTANNSRLQSSANLTTKNWSLWLFRLCNAFQFVEHLRLTKDNKVMLMIHSMNVPLIICILNSTNFDMHQQLFQ